MMGNWGISPNASEKEKIKSEWADELNGKNSTGKITYDVYSELFDVGMDLLDKMYELGKFDGEKRKKSRWTALEQIGFFAKKYECKVCKSVVDMGCYSRGCDYDYCPYCGAEMEGEYGEDSRE